MYSVLNTFSEYTQIYISKIITSYTFLLVFKIIECLQWILGKKILAFRICARQDFNKEYVFTEIIVPFPFSFMESGQWNIWMMCSEELMCKLSLQLKIIWSYLNPPLHSTHPHPIYKGEGVSFLNSSKKGSFRFSL